MKKFLFITLIISLFSFNSLASNECQKKGDDWKQKMMSEKIAFLTTEIGLTPEEGQQFWPVYNQVNKEKDEVMYNLHMSYKELRKAVNENRSEKDIQKALDTYLESLERQREADTKAADRFKKVLPIEKVAKLYIAEEQFRRHQIHKLHEGKKN